jgi:hypothetical protein
VSGGGIAEGVVEQAAPDWFRSQYDQVVLTGRLRDGAVVAQSHGHRPRRSAGLLDAVHNSDRRKPRRRK